ncbi:Coatomer subunit delta [Thoreauomyces humboldtii]|nr:Coatomer subunit delta [Thoreauomyces humboldtii]
MPCGFLFTTLLTLYASSCRKVVLAASVCTKAGKAVVSRQFVEMPRSRIEGLLASFPKLIGAADSQHTFVETDSVRYVYQPLDELYMVLVTNKHSNILQDIDTLHLFARLISDYCRSLNERDIALQAFELAHVFDEVVSLGYRENVNLAQIRTITEMESHEERVQAEIAKSQEKQAKEDSKRKAKMMEMQRKEMARSGYSGGGGGGSGGGYQIGYGSGSSNSNHGYGGGGGGGFRSGSPYESVRQSAPEPERPSYAAPVASSAPARGKGMQLGGKQTDSTFVNTIKADEGIPDAVPQPISPVHSSSAFAAPVHHAASSTESVHVALEEKITVVANRDGGLQTMEIKGDMQLKVSDPAKAQLRVVLDMQRHLDVQYKTHPNVDKPLFNNSDILGLRDPTRPFPINQALPIVKWRYVTNDESLMPLAINCWPSPSGNGTCDVNIEYELQSDTLELRDVIISIPYSGNAPPTVGDVEGEYEIDRARKFIQWQLPIVDQSNKSGVLEFSAQGDDAGAFFPIRVSFTSSKTFCNIAVRDITAVDGTPTVFSQETVLLTEDYSVV